MTINRVQFSTGVAAGADGVATSTGYTDGPMVGRVLREVEDWWIDHDFLDDPMSAVEKLKAVVQGLAY